MKKFFVLACVMSLFLVPGAFAFETPTVGPLDPPVVDGGEIVGDPETLPAETITEIFAVLAEEMQSAVVDGGTVNIALNEGGTSATVTVVYPDGTGTAYLVVYNNQTGKWEKIESPSPSAAGLAVAAAPESLNVTDGGPYDQNPTQGVVQVSYAAAREVPVSSGSSSGGCSVGSLSGFAALALLLGPGFFLLRRK